MKNRFYLRSPHGDTGSNMVFHAKDGKGYTTNLDQAHVYTLKEAQAKYDQARNGEHPVSADHAYDLSAYKVDHQYLPTKSDLSRSFEYVAFQKGIWDGNDVYWVWHGGISSKLKDADIISRTEALKIDQSKFVVIPFELACKKARRTFDAAFFNHRTMITGAGLRMPKHLKKRNRRVVNPMTRFNCPSCGKINWQHSPYDFDCCKYCDCVRVSPRRGM